jgi:hypothetical protein
MEIVLVFNEEDTFSIKEFSYLNPIITPPNFYAVDAWNEAAKKASFEWLVLAADDVLFPPNLFDICLQTWNKGFIGFEDGTCSARGFATHYMLTKDWCRKYQGGVFAVPHYKSWGIDPETNARAVRSGTYILLPEPQIQHLHPIFNSGIPADETFKRAQPFHQKDVLLFEERRAKGFPNDFKGYL